MNKPEAFVWNVRYLYEVQRGLGWVATGRVLRRYIKRKVWR
jgi:hypothetical protein